MHPGNWRTARIGRRAALRRLGLLGAGLPLGLGLLAACSPSTAVAPTSPATTGAAPPTTAPAAAKPAVSPAGSPASSPAAVAAPSPIAAASPITAASPVAAVSSKPKVTIAFTQEPTSLDPTADATASIATLLRDNLYEGLVRLDGSGKLLGSLARSWDVSPDGTVVTFH